MHEEPMTSNNASPDVCITTATEVEKDWPLREPLREALEQFGVTGKTAQTALSHFRVYLDGGGELTNVSSTTLNAWGITDLEKASTFLQRLDAIHQGLVNNGQTHLSRTNSRVVTFGDWPESRDMPAQEQARHGYRSGGEGMGGSERNVRGDMVVTPSSNSNNYSAHTISANNQERLRGSKQPPHISTSPSGSSVDRLRALMVATRGSSSGTSKREKRSGRRHSEPNGSSSESSPSLWWRPSLSMHLGRRWPRVTRAPRLQTTQHVSDDDMSPVQGGPGGGMVPFKRSDSLEKREGRRSHSVDDVLDSTGNVLRRGRIRPGKWKLGNRIAEGSFGVVYMGLNEVTGELIAVKVLSLPGCDRDVTELYQEMSLMRRFSHPNIVSYLGAEILEEQEQLCIFQEWVPGGSVASLLKRFGPFAEDMTRRYTRQILQGLRFLHENKVVHRDIKGSNILVDDKGVVKLADFGASQPMASLETDPSRSLKGTPYFMAPEVLQRKPHGLPVDIWSLGCAVLQMLTGRPPWQETNASTPSALLKAMLEREGLPPIYPPGLSSSLISMLNSCF